jgi:putative permease
MQRQLKIKLVLFFIVLTATIIFAINFPRLTLPFGVAYIVYLTASPLMVMLSTGPKRQRVFFFALLVLGVVFSLLPVFALINSVDTKISMLSSQMPSLQMILQEKFSDFKSLIQDNFGFTITADPVTLLVQYLQKMGSLLINEIPDYLSYFFEWILLLPMFLYFFFFQSKKLGTKILEFIPNPIFEKTYVLFSQFNTKFGEYIMAKFIEATILGTLVTLGLLVVGFPYPFILGFIAGVTNILPYLGPILGVIPAMLVILLSPELYSSIWVICFIYTLANLIDMVVVFPLLVSKVVNLNPIIVVVSVIVGGQVAGVVGMIIIIPFIAFFKILFEEIYKDLSVQL